MAVGLKSISQFAVIVAFLLTLATWVFFYKRDLPLNTASTTVVFGAWFVIAAAVKWIWMRIRTARPNG